MGACRRCKLCMHQAGKELEASGCWRGAGPLKGPPTCPRPCPLGHSLAQLRCLCRNLRPRLVATTVAGHAADVQRQAVRSERRVARHRCQQRRRRCQLSAALLPTRVNGAACLQSLGGRPPGVQGGSGGEGGRGVACEPQRCRSHVGLVRVCPDGLRDQRVERGAAARRLPSEFQSWWGFPMHRLWFHPILSRDRHIVVIRIIKTIIECPGRFAEARCTAPLSRACKRHCRTPAALGKHESHRVQAICSSDSVPEGQHPLTAATESAGHGCGEVAMQHAGLFFAALR